MSEFENARFSGRGKDAEPSERLDLVSLSQDELKARLAAGTAKIEVETFYRPKGSGSAWTKHDKKDLGSGFVVTEDGKIATARHVVEPAVLKQIRDTRPDLEAAIKVTVKIGDKKYVVDGSSIKLHPYKDLALLENLQEVNAAGNPVGPTRDRFMPLKLAESLDLPPGARIFKAGHPGGREEKDYRAGQYEVTRKAGDFAIDGSSGPEAPGRPLLKGRIYTRKGDSGAAIVDENGHVIGVIKASNVKKINGVDEPFDPTRHYALAETVDGVKELLGQRPLDTERVAAVPKAVPYREPGVPRPPFVPRPPLVSRLPDSVPPRSFVPPAYMDVPRAPYPMDGMPLGRPSDFGSDPFCMDDLGRCDGRARVFMALQMLSRMLDQLIARLEGNMPLGDMPVPGPGEFLDLPPIAGFEPDGRFSGYPGVNPGEDPFSA